MATLGDFLSNPQKATIKADAVAATKARKSSAKSAVPTDNISENVWNMIYDIAYEMGQKLDRAFWGEINAHIGRHIGHVICLKGHNMREIMPVVRNVVWAKHFGQMLKDGYRIVYVRENGFASEVTWDNWSRVYRSLTTEPDARGYDIQPTKREVSQIRTARRKEKEFYDLARPIRTKKGGRMRISFEEARDQRVKMERIDYECKVVSTANKILEVL